MKIRKAVSSDFSQIQRLNKELFKFEEQFGHEYNLNWPYQEEGIKYFERIQSSDKAIVYVAEENSTIIGYIIAFVYTFSYRKTNPICEIENMFTEERYRNKGIGKSLIFEVRKEARKKNVKRLRVGAIVQNEKAINFYRNNGFKDVNLYLEEKL